MSISMKRYNDTIITPKDDRILFDQIFDDYGLIYGGSATMAASNKIHVGAARGFIKGTEVIIEAEDIAVNLSDSGTKNGRLKIVMDLADTETPIKFESEVAASFPALEQDANINYDNGRYEVVFATYKTTETTISSVTLVMPTMQSVKAKIQGINQSLTIINENLIPYPYHETTRTINGVTFIDNGDGTITANGTATDDLIFWIKYFNDLEIDDNIKYTISGSPNGSSSGKYCLSARVYTKKDAPSPSSGKIIRVSQAGTVVTGYKYIAPYISVWKGVTLNNVIFKPMLEYGTVASDYKQYSMSNAGLQEQIEMCKENLIPFPYCATSTGSYAKSFNSSSLTTVEAKNDGSLLIGSNGKIPSKTNQVLFRLIHDNFENIPLYNDIYSMDPHFENRPSASGVALAVSFERAKDSELETFYVTSPVEINNIDGKYTKIKYISVWLSTATASFENVKMKPTITRGGITEKRDVVSQKLSMDAIVARTRNSLNIVHLPLKETKTLTLAQLYNSYAKQNDVLYVTVIDYSDSKSYKSSTMLLFIDDFQIYAISTEGLLKYDNVNDKWAVIIPRA